MKNNKRLGLALSGLIMSSTIVSADGILPVEKNDSWRPVIGLGGGVSIPQSLGKFTNFSISNPVTDLYYIYTPTNGTSTEGLFEAFLGAERQFSPTFIFQGGLAYTYTGSVLAKGYLLQGADADSDSLYNYQYKIGTQELLVQAKFMRPYHERFFPYALGGIGVAFNRVAQFKTSVPSDLDVTRAYEDNSPISFAYRVGLGFDVGVLEHMRVGVAYRYTGMGPVGLGSSSLGGATVSGTLKQANLNFNEILAQVTYVR